MKPYKKPVDVKALEVVAMINGILALFVFGTLIVACAAGLIYPKSPTGVPFDWQVVRSLFDTFMDLCPWFLIPWGLARLVNRVHETHHICKRVELELDSQEND